MIRKQAVEPLLFSVDEAVAVLRLSPWTLRAWLSAGKIGSIKLGSRRLIIRAEIDRLITEGTVPATKESK